MTSITLTVKGAKAQASVSGHLTSGMVGIPVTIEYDDAWNGLTKNLVCRCGKWGAEKGETRTILNIGESTTVAHEVLKPNMHLYLGIEGYSTNEKMVMPTTWADCGLIWLGATSNEDPSANPELPIWAQLQWEIRQIKDQIVTEEQIAASVAAYLEENPIEVPETPQSSVLSTAQITTLDNMFKICAFTKDNVSTEYNAFQTAFGITDSGDSGDTETPDEPVVPEVTLTGISATYGGGDVAVGTAVTDLTGIVVTAHYSDGSSEAVTGYALSGEIAEGENTITVSYQGKTATFTVNGITESTGENNGWVDDQAYELNKVDCLSLDTTTGETVEAESGTMVTDFLPCLGVSAISWTGFDSASILNNVLYNEEKNFIKANGLLDARDPNTATNATYYYVVPEGTAYLRFTQRSSIKYLTSVTPHKYPVLTETTECETGRWYESGAVLGYVNANDGTFTSSSSWYVTGYCMVYGASKAHFSLGTRKAVVFYDGNKNYISGTTVNGTTTFEIPENAVYMVASSVDMNNLHIWLEP